jgi:hypothetical protein
MNDCPNWTSFAGWNFTLFSLSLLVDVMLLLRRVWYLTAGQFGKAVNVVGCVGLFLLLLLLLLLLDGKFTTVAKF